MRKVILYIAMSLDGYIADENGGVDWLNGHQEHVGNYESYERLMTHVDCILMGYKTYQQITNELFVESWPYQGYQTYVLTHQDEIGQKEIAFVNQPIEEVIHHLKEVEGKDIWLCGGTSLVTQCLEKNLIDEFQIAIIPTLLSKGVRLFEETNQMLLLNLESLTQDNGIIECVYSRRK